MGHAKAFQSGTGGAKFPEEGQVSTGQGRRLDRLIGGRRKVRGERLRIYLKGIPSGSSSLCHLKRRKKVLGGLPDAKHCVEKYGPFLLQMASQNKFCTGRLHESIGGGRGSDSLPSFPKELKELLSGA